MNPETLPQDNTVPSDPLAPIQQTLATLQQKIETIEKRESDLVRVLQDNMTPKGDAGQAMKALGPDPKAELMYLLAQANAELRNHKAIEDEYSEKYPELLPFKEVVLHMAMQHCNDAQMQGQQVDDKTALETVIAKLQTTLADYVKSSQQKQQGDAMKRQALSFNVGQSSPPVSANITDQLDSIGDDDAAFAKLKASYLKSRGVNL